MRLKVMTTDLWKLLASELIISIKLSSRFESGCDASLGGGKVSDARCKQNKRCVDRVLTNQGTAAS